MTTGEKIRACPFCGVEPEMESTSFKGKVMYAVACNNIKCPVQPITPFCLTKGAATRAWNWRGEK